MAADSLFTWYCFLSALYMLALLQDRVCLAVNGGDSIAFGASLTGNQSIVSKNGSFELGFFCLNGTNNWYIGIWYAQMSDKTIVWVANRETPIRNKPGVLKLSRDGYLKLYDSEGRSIWSARENQKGRASRATILDSGSFVMLGAHNISEIVWESFLFPGDTWLPGMKMWKGMKLTSWKSSLDPAPGPFSIEMDPAPDKEQFLLVFNNNITYWSTGEWEVDHFIGLPEMLIKGNGDVFPFVKISPTRMYFSYFQISNFDGIMQRAVMHKTGEIRMYYRIPDGIWNLVWSGPGDPCNIYDVCGAYGACQSGNLGYCRCLKGFNPKDNRAWDSKEWWSSGCVRSSPLHCSLSNGTTDGFLQNSDISLPVEAAVPYSHYTTLPACRAACLENCSCTAFDLTNSTVPICRMWFGDLFNIRVALNSQPVFLRMAASELSQSISNRGTAKVRILSISLPAGTAFILLLAFLVVMFVWRRRGILVKEGDREDGQPASMRTFTYRELQIATNNFSDKLGKGGFGSVYKGALPDNTLVAVKKLEVSTQVEKQFRAEISTIGNIQHANLVRLYGFCTEASERLLVYEYMPNGSLSSFLFAKSDGSQKLLKWKTRYQIALGIARGLVYLHEEYRDQIIHADIKADNILLDRDFSAKVADFGLAKLVGRDFSRVLTSMRGTRGYIAPEWLEGFAVTSKADVFSFGMMLLEIISGRRIVDMSVEERTKQYFPAWAATQIEKENFMSIVDERIAKHADAEEVRRAILASIACIAKDENERPSMAHAVLMLQGKVNSDTQVVMKTLHCLLELYSSYV